MLRKTVKSRSKSVTKRLGKTTGNRKPPLKGKTKVRPKGNPLKGTYGVKITKTF